VEFIRSSECTVLRKSGLTSRQLLFPENSNSERVTITRVSVAPGAKNTPHRHAESEQIWVALKGSGHLLLEGGTTMPFGEGDIARFEDGDLHGFENTSDAEFEYLAITSPPVNFRSSYKEKSK
jgi:quercetin dioxygenase-like cupin family protein